MINKNKLLRITTYIFLVVIILAVIIPVIISTGYTYPCEDDFGYEAGGKIYAENHGNFRGALIGAYDYYLHWQGTYVPNFLLYFIRAYPRFGLLGFHVVMISLILLTIFAVFILVQALIKEKLGALVILCATYIILFNSSPTGLEREFIYWYTGALTYQLAFALACITLAITLQLKQKMPKKKQLYFLLIIGCITGFISSGGTLAVASFNCSWLLLFLILNYKEVLQKKLLTIPFVASFIGALINACAKGNFIRSDVSGGIGYSVTDALQDTFICWKEQWHVIFENKFLLILFALVFISCFIFKIRIFHNGISNTHMLMILPAIFLIQYFTAFPIILGYHGSSLIYLRTTYTYELLVKLMILFGLICFAQWLREQIKPPKYIPIIIAFVISLYATLSGNIWSDITGGLSYQATQELCNGKIQELYEFRVHVLALIEESEKGTDVYLKVPSVPPSSIMYGMGLTTDAYSNCNSSAARYYGFNSLRIEYSDEYTFPE